MGISLSNKPGHMAKSGCRIRCKCKIWCFTGCLFYYYDTTISAKTVYIRGNQEKLDQWMIWKHQWKDANF